MRLSKKSKIFLFGFLIILIVAYGAYTYAYKPHATTESLETSFSGTSDDLLTKIQENPDEWQDKIVQLSGKITSKDDKGITLSESIYCQFRDPLKLSNLVTQETILIKGRIIGYDDLLEELKLDQCIIQQ